MAPGVIGNAREQSTFLALALSLLLLFQSIVAVIPGPGGLLPAFGDSVLLAQTENDANTNPPKPQIALDGDSGNVYVVWQDYNSTSGANDILFAERESGATDFVNTTISVTENPLDNPPNPKIALDQETGDVFVIWQALDSDSSDLMLATKDAGESEFEISTLGSSSEIPDSTGAAIAVDSSIIYAAWLQDGDIVLANGTGGAFNVTVAVGSDLLDSPANIRIAASNSGQNLFLVWQDGQDLRDVFFARSLDGGQNFDEPTNLSGTTDESLNPTLFVPASGGTITVAWQELVDSGGSSTYEVFLRQSSDDGFSFADAANYSNSEGIDSVNPSLSAAPDNSDVFLSWEELSFVSLTSEIFVSTSSDSGQTFGCPTKVAGSSDFSGASAQLAADGAGTVFAVWEDVNGFASTNDIIFFDDLDYDVPYVTLLLESDNPDSNFDGMVESKWGIASENVTVSGRFANADGGNGDFVRIDWGDGVSTDDVELSSGCTWEAASHVYDQAAAGNGIAQITAALLDENDAVMATASTPISVAIMPHATELILNPIPSIRQGGQISVSGILLDADSGDVGISGVPVIFDGTGADFGLSLETATTDAGGEFSLNASASEDVANEWAVQAHFTGDIGYDFSDSQVQFYDTVEENATAIAVNETGSDVTVSLDGFGAQITFEEIEDLSDGLVYVSECTPAESARFEILTGDDSGCLSISPGVQMAADSVATLAMTYDDQAVPAGHTENDISLFHALSQDQSTFADITRSRDISANTVTGETAFFGVFVAAAAVHQQAGEGAVRHQLFVGDDNFVEFRDIDDPTNSTASISLDKAKYSPTDTAALTIDDGSNANVNPAIAESITAQVQSATSGSNGITLTLVETGPDTGIFQASFTFTTTGNSSGTTLRVSRGDSLTVLYEPVLGGRLGAELDGLAEAGVVDLSDFEIIADSTPFNPVGYAVNLKLVDAQLDAESGLITVTMSYANADLGGSDVNYLRLYQGEDLGDGTANWNSDPISEVDGDGHTVGLDTAAKTVTAQTTSHGVFLMGYDVGSPGGAGGGIGKPGSGLVLDFVAGIAASSGGGGGGGGGSNTTPPPAPPIPAPHQPSGTSDIPAGNENEVTVTVTGGSGTDSVGVKEVKLAFQNVTTAGSVTVTTETLGGIAHLFDSSIGNHGHLEMNGANYTTTGLVYDIESSSQLKFEGIIDVTIPYDESLVKSANGSDPSGVEEGDVRFLHYNGSLWEDVTIALNTTTNTVTGRLTSGMSPVVAAVIDDGTFGSRYFRVNPLAKLAVSDIVITEGISASPVGSVSPGMSVTFSTSIQNHQRTTQEYVLILEIFTPEGYVDSILFRTGQLQRGEATDLAMSWTAPEAEGQYLAKVLILSGLEADLMLLAEPTVESVNVED